MIQFNLLPDVKLEFIRAKRMKRMVIVIATIVIAVCISLVLGLVAVVYGLQRNHIANLNEDIARDTRTIQEIEDINRILTVQNQLNTINGLHDQKPVTSRFFEYIEELTPSDVSINRIELDQQEGTMRLSGETTSLATVNKFIDTLKFTNYRIVTDDTDEIDSEENEANELPAFNGVVLSSFGRANEEASYVIDLNFDSTIFDSSSRVVLTLRERITTRSEVDRPIFQTPQVEPELEGVENE